MGDISVLDSTTNLALPADNHRAKLGDVALIVSLCLVLYLAGNGRVSLWDRDEAWYAQTAREMVQRSDYVVPTFNGEPRFRKPVLIYWLMATAYSVFGDNEFGARFFSGIAGTVTCLLTYRLGTRIGGRAVGLVAALMLAVAPFMVIESKLATTDAVLTAALVGAMSCVWELHDAGFSWRRSLTFWFLIGVLVLTKGPFGPAFIACGVAAWLLLSRQWSVLSRMNWLPGLAVVLALCLPWGVAIYRATDGEFYRVALGDQALGHSLGSMNNHRGFPGFYLVIALAGLLPWSLLLPFGLSGVRQWFRGPGPESFLLGWIIGPLIMVELMRTKLPQYYLPAFPAWSLLIARGVVDFHAAGHRLVKSAGGLRRVIVLGVLGPLAAIVFAAFVLTRGPAEVRAPALVAAAVLGAGSMMVLVLLKCGRDRAGWAATVGAWWSLGIVVAAWLLPAAENCRVARASVDALRARAGDKSAVVLFGYREPSLVFYLGQPVPTFNSPKELAHFLDERGPVVTLLRDSDMNRLRKQPEICVEPIHCTEPLAIQGINSTCVHVARLSVVTNRDPTAMNERERRVDRN
jgi:4-amino-4-deoxy-L-arabinose transferase-like glycosyltransferase